MKRKYVGLNIDVVLFQEDIITESYGACAHKDVEDIYGSGDWVVNG